MTGARIRGKGYGGLIGECFASALAGAIGIDFLDVLNKSANQ